MLRFCWTLTRLKGLLLWRYYSKHWGAALAVVGIFGMLLVLNLAGLGALYELVREGEAKHRLVVAQSVLWITTLIWLMAPFSPSDMKRSLDLGGLRLTPHGRWHFLLAVLVDALVSPLALFLGVVLSAMLLLFSTSAAGALLLLAALAMLALALLGLGQALHLWALNIINSRRCSDLSIVGGLVFFIGIQFLRFLFISPDDSDAPAWLLGIMEFFQAYIAPLFALAFPSLVAKISSFAAAGNLTGALVLLPALLLQALACLGLASLAARQYYEGELEGSGTATRRRRRSQRTWRSGSIPVAVASIFYRERVYIFRDPLVKMMLTQSLFMGIYIVVMAILMGMRFGEESATQISGYVLLGVVMFMSFGEAITLFNKFGYEGAQVAQLFLAPVDRAKILLAKSLMLLPVLLVVNVVSIGVLAVVLRVSALFAATGFVLLVLNLAVLDLAGHFISIWLPVTFRRQGRRMRAQMPQPGCLHSLLYTLIFNAAMVAMLPGGLAVVGGAVFFSWPGLIGGTLVALVLTGGAYWLLFPHAVRQLEAREQRLVEILSREPG